MGSSTALHGLVRLRELNQAPCSSIFGYLPSMPVRLLARRPSPTTVSFTVSNASSRASSTAKLLFVCQIALRTLLLFCVLLVGIAKLRHVPFVHKAYVTHLEAVWSDSWGSLVCRIVDSYSGWVIAGISALVVYGVFRRNYTGMRNAEGVLPYTNRVCRRSTAGYTRSWHPDLDFVCDIPVQSSNAIYTSYADTGYRDPRSFQRL